MIKVALFKFYIGHVVTVIYVVTVSASNGLLRGFTDVIVYVTDVNDNPPTFSQSQSTISVIENAPADVIMTFTAHDDDVGHNALVTYALIG